MGTVQKKKMFRTQNERERERERGMNNLVMSTPKIIRKARLRTIAPSPGSFATSETPSSRRKAEIQYEKFWRIPCPPMTAYREGWLGHQDIFTIVLES
jgi:hypothetical protein